MYQCYYCYYFQNSNIQWKSIYRQKLSDIKVHGLREFNFKLINNLVPCGHWLHKWKREISERCDYCNEPETTQHMIYACPRIKEIWNLFSLAVNCSISWKHLVCGWPSYDNTRKIWCLNILISIIAYSIFRLNSKCKFDKIKYGQIAIKCMKCISKSN